MIENTAGRARKWDAFDEHENCVHFLDFLTGRFWSGENRTRVFGVTVSKGAYEKHIGADAGVEGPTRTESRFMAGEVIDLVGAGDSFRAGFLTYVARNIDGFRQGTIDFSRAVQMGNLFAALYIKAPLDDRYGHIKGYRKMLKAVTSGRIYETFDELMAEVG